LVHNRTLRHHVPLSLKPFTHKNDSADILIPLTSVSEDRTQTERDRTQTERLAATEIVSPHIFSTTSPERAPARCLTTAWFENKKIDARRVTDNIRVHRDVLHNLF
jgi:hypothetical protein